MMSRKTEIRLAELHRQLEVAKARLTKPSPKKNLRLERLIVIAVEHEIAMTRIGYGTDK